jgi:hypothetical protein
MKTTKPQTEELLVMVQCCHSVLSTAWPRPGFSSLAESGRFIGTKLFSALENADNELRRLFQEACKEGIDKQYGEILEHCHQIIVFLKQLESNRLHPSIDPAFNLLYLATGVIYQEIAASLPTVPEQDNRFATVEELKSLVSICKWETGVDANLISKLNVRLEEVARELSIV